jgi:hypothetical protein
MRRRLTSTAVVSVSLALAACGGSTATTSSPTKQSTTATAAAKPHVAPVSQAVTIVHVVRGCHAWSTGATKQTLHLGIGSALTVINSDVMPHELVTLSGGSGAVLTHAKMNHMSAKGTITFAQRGTYRFTTKAGEDYMKGVKTIGPDNTLKLTVVVA